MTQDRTNDRSDFTSVWVDQNTAIIRREKRERIRRALVTAAAILAGAALFSLVFWGALAAAQSAADAAPRIMRF